MRILALLVATTLATAASAMPGTSATQPAPGAAASNPHGTPAATQPVAKIAKATGPDARTVAEVVGGAPANKDKTVAVKGQVVKVTAGVLGKNWIHLQDGSGTAAKGTHDLVVTTTEEAKPGEVVTVKGTVKTDVDIGSGYKYPVLVADAKLKR
jgi:DNA/RNA endonuclease YhcR with UshA esterase domain